MDAEGKHDQQFPISESHSQQLACMVPAWHPSAPETKAQTCELATTGHECMATMLIGQISHILHKQAQFYIRAGALPPNLSFAPNFDTKHCLTNSKLQHKSEKGVFCGLQNMPKCISGDSAQTWSEGHVTLVGWRGDTQR